jgi:hypothetical protein
MKSSHTTDAEALQMQLTDYQEMHNTYCRIVKTKTDEQRESLVCDLFGTHAHACRTGLFLLNRKNGYFHFRTYAGKNNGIFTGSYLGFDPSQIVQEIVPLNDTAAREICLETNLDLHDFKDKHVYLAPIKGETRVYGILLFELNGSYETLALHQRELMQLLLHLIYPFVKGFVESRHLKEKTRALKLLYDVGSTLNSIRDEDLLLDKILELIDLHLGIDRCSIMILDPRKNALCIKKAIGMGDMDISKIRVPVGEGIAGYVAAGSRPLLIRDISTEVHLVSRARQNNQYTTNSLLSVPLVAEGQVIGVINVNNRKDGLPFTEEDQDLLSAIGAEIAVVLQRSYMKLQLKKHKMLDQDINRFMV